MVCPIPGTASGGGGGMKRKEKSVFCLAQNVGTSAIVMHTMSPELIMSIHSSLHIHFTVLGHHSYVEMKLKIKRKNIFS